MRRLQQILVVEPTLADLVRRQQRTTALKHCIDRILPKALAAQVSVANPEPPNLELVAGSGAVAAMTRQHIPALLQKLAAEGWKFTGIHLRVQVRPAGQQRIKGEKKQIDSTTTERLFALAARLGEGPLAAALKRLAGLGDPPRSNHQDPLQGKQDQDPQ